MIALSGCGLFGRGDPDVSTAAFAGCGPADGPAMSIYVTQSSLSCSSESRILQGRHGEFLRIWILGISDVVTPFTVQVGSDVYEGAWAGRCSAISDCVDAASGTISLEDPDSLGIPVITYELVFEDGHTESGAHAFRFCKRQYLCG